MTKKKARKQLKEWLEPLRRFAELPLLEEGEYDNGTPFIKVRIPVRRGEYVLSAHFRDKQAIYLGGFWRADAGGGRDMHDGPFSKETFDKFLADVVAHQVVAEA